MIQNQQLQVKFVIKQNKNQSKVLKSIRIIHPIHQQLLDYV